MWSESGRNSSTHSRPKQLDDRKPENDRIFGVSSVRPALLLCPQLRTYCGIENDRNGSDSDLSRCLRHDRFTPGRWGNRPASLWIAEDFWVLRFRLMVKRGPWTRPQASEGEAQHGPFCWTGRFGQGDECLHCG